MTYLRNQVARIANINIETLRYYEQNGLIPSPIRDKNRYRLYDDDTIERLKIIKYAKACGFSLEETKNILAIVDRTDIDYKCIVEYIDKKVMDINEKIEHLDNMKVILNKINSNINSQIQCPIKSTFKDL